MPGAEVRHFARAALEVAVTLGAVEDFLERFTLLARLHHTNRVFRHFLVTRRVAIKDKMKVLHRTFEGVLTDLEYQVLAALLERNLGEDLPAVTRAMVHQSEAEALRLSLTVTTARPLDPRGLQDLEGRVEKMLDRPLKVTGVTDPGLIGGIKLRLGNTLLDGSVARRLERMREQLV